MARLFMIANIGNEAESNASGLWVLGTIFHAGLPDE